MGIKLGKGKVISKGGQNTQGLEIALSKLGDGESIRLRLIGEVEPNYRYWVPCANGKNKPVITPYFDKETEVISSSDPLLGEGRKEFFYTINALDRASNEMKILILKTTIYRTLASFAMDEEYGDPTDEKTGYDVTITKEKTGPKIMNVKYELRPSPKVSPLTESELSMPLHDLAELYAPKDEAEYLEWIKINTDILNVVPTSPLPAPEEAAVNSNPVDEDDIPF